MTRIVLVFAGLVYVFLWVVAAQGATILVAPLLIPAVLAVMVALGVALNRFVGITPRRPHFDDRDDEKEQ
jgi:hypothetical protein